MRGRPPPTPDAIARINALGEAAILAFFDELPAAALGDLRKHLPKVAGFRTTSPAGHQQQKKLLAKRLAAKSAHTSPQADRDHNALYVVWRHWAAHRFRQAGNIDALLDKIEAAREGASDEDETFRHEIESTFTTLREWSHENKCAREDIERLFTFSPFSSTDTLRQRIAASKSTADIEREKEYAALPARLQHDEEALTALKIQVADLSRDVKALTDQLANFAPSAAGPHLTRTEVNDLIRAEVARNATAIAPLATRVDHVEARGAELTDQLAQIRSDVARVIDGIQTLSTAPAKPDPEVANVLRRLDAVEARSLSDADASMQLLTALSEELRALAGQIEAVAKPTDATPLQDVLLRIEALEKFPAPRTATSEADVRHFAASSPLPRMMRDSAKVSELRSLSEAVTVLSDSLQDAGLKPAAANTLATEIAASVVSGQIAFFRGSLAAEVARACARALGGVHSFRASIPVGLTDGEELRDRIEHASALAEGTTPLFIVEGANRSALEIYADVLFDEVTLGASVDANTRGAFIFATIVEGLSALPVDERYLDLGPIFHLDHLDWRLHRAAPRLGETGVVTARTRADWRKQIAATTVDPEEPLRLARKFSRGRSLRLERNLVTAQAALTHLSRTPVVPSVLQSLSFGWLLPLWSTQGVSKEDADNELDAGKCDVAAADPRIASYLASDAFLTANSGGEK